MRTKSGKWLFGSALSGLLLCGLAFFTAGCGRQSNPESAGNATVQVMVEKVDYGLDKEYSRCMYITTRDASGVLRGFTIAIESEDFQKGRKLEITYDPKAVYATSRVNELVANEDGTKSVVKRDVKWFWIVKYRVIENK